MPQATKSLGYQRLLQVAKLQFDAGKEDEFYQYAQEGQYFIELWVAHLLLEHGAPSADLAVKALAIIRRYAAPHYRLNEDVAQQEVRWLAEYRKRKAAAS